MINFSLDIATALSVLMAVIGLLLEKNKDRKIEQVKKKENDARLINDVIKNNI